MYCDCILIVRKYILKYLEIKGHNISDLFSNGSEKIVVTHMYTYTHREYDKANGIRWKLFSLRRVNGSSLYCSYNCSMYLKLYIKVKSYQKKKKSPGEGWVWG